MALGQAVHEVIEGLSVLSVERRLERPLLERLEDTWKKITGRRGGFFNPETEGRYKDRARKMLKGVEKNPGPLTNLAVKINQELPYYWLSEPDNLILCGKIDWLEYLKDKDAAHIIDFKTGRGEEKTNSLQLPIYYLLASHAQKRPVIKLSYWYIDRDSRPREQKLPDIKQAEAKILKIAKEMKLARQLNRFKCPNEGCRECREMEQAVSGQAELVGHDAMGREVYVLQPDKHDEKSSEIL